MSNQMQFRSSGRPLALLGALLCLSLTGGTALAQAKPEGEKPKAQPAETKPAGPAEKEAPKPDKSYRLQPGDEISVTVSPQKEYNGEGVILPDGTLSLKKVGEIKAAGMTRQQLAAHIQKILNEDLVDPEVTVGITKLVVPERPEPPKPLKVTVVGAVVKPGAIEVDRGTLLAKAIDLAGGTKDDADLKEILILHADKTKTIVDLSSQELLQDPRHNFVLEEGDAIRVAAVPPVEKKFVRISGAVAKPARYELPKEGLLLDELIERAGKMPITADPRHLELRRKGEPVQILDLEALTKKGTTVQLQVDDLVHIPEFANTVLLVGAIQNPGLLPLPKEGTTIREFFRSPVAASALDPQRVELRSVQIQREGQEAIQVDLMEALKKEDSKHNVELKSGDVVFMKGKMQKDSLGGALRVIPYIGVLSSLFGLF